MANGYTGGCCCGAGRYQVLSEPFDTGWCHCRTCQLNSGSPAMAFASVPVADFLIEQGEPAATQIGAGLKSQLQAWLEGQL